MYDGVMDKVRSRVNPAELLKKPEYGELRARLAEEISEDYQFSVRRSIGTYVHVLCSKLPILLWMYMYNLCLYFMQSTTSLRTLQKWQG